MKFCQSIHDIADHRREQRDSKEDDDKCKKVAEKIAEDGTRNIAHFKFSQAFLAVHFYKMTDDDRRNQSIDGPAYLCINSVQREIRTDTVETRHIVGACKIYLEKYIQRTRDQRYRSDKKKDCTEEDAEILTNKPPGFPEDPPEASHTLKS